MGGGGAKTTDVCGSHVKLHVNLKAEKSVCVCVCGGGGGGEASRPAHPSPTWMHQAMRVS